jgi:hypothetical protein
MLLADDDQSFVVEKPQPFLQTMAKLSESGFDIEGMPHSPLPIYPLKVFRLLATTKPYLLTYRDSASGSEPRVMVHSHSPQGDGSVWGGAFGKRIQIDIVSK